MLDLAAEELADMRQDAEGTLPNTCNIVTATRTRDARGQVSVVTVTGPDFPCAVVPVDMAAEQELVARIGTEPGYRISMPLSVVVSEADQIGFDVEGDVRLVNVVGAVMAETDAPLRVVLTSEGAT